MRLAVCRPKVDNSGAVFAQQQAAQARQAEAARAARVRQGMGAIDENFGRFDDGFYDQRGEAYMDFYQPQLTDQYNDALARLTYSLARAGTTNSSIAGDAMADLQKQREMALADLSAGREGDVSNLRSRVQSEKDNLVAQLNATGDADMAANQALTRTQNLYSDQPQFVSLGDLFGNIGNSIGAYRSGMNSGSRTGAFQQTAGISASNPRRPAGQTIS